MIIAVDEIMALPEFANQNETIVANKLKAIELMIRAYTNNNFQNRQVRFLADSQSNQLIGDVPAFLKVGDTVQITQSSVNNGLYVITGIADTHIEVDEDLYSCCYNLVTKVEYPIDIKVGVTNLMQWEIKNRQKVGIKSETLSRHSVTYFDQDASNQVMGYPVSLLGFLKPYMRARF